MRKVLVLAALAVPLVIGINAAPVAAAKKPPVELSGKVNNHGTKTAKTKIDVEQDDNYFKPTFIKAKPGKTLKVELENEGNNTHNFSIEALNIDVTVSAGKKKTVSVKVPSSGALNFFCKFHHDLGMQGAIFPEAGAAVSNSNTKTSTGGSPGGYGYGY